MWCLDMFSSSAKLTVTSEHSPCQLCRLRPCWPTLIKKRKKKFTLEQIDSLAGVSTQNKVMFSLLALFNNTPVQNLCLVPPDHLTQHSCVHVQLLYFCQISFPCSSLLPQISGSLSVLSQTALCRHAPFRLLPCNHTDSLGGWRPEP